MLPPMFGWSKLGVSEFWTGKVENNFSSWLARQYVIVVFRLVFLKAWKNPLFDRFLHAFPLGLRPFAIVTMLVYFPEVFSRFSARRRRSSRIYSSICGLISIASRRIRPWGFQLLVGRKFYLITGCLLGRGWLWFSVI